ncbi:fatty-acyl-CoA synthase/long-chain acyl-CoA synthetase [Acinetobacter calcoaceticus]|uniref:Fatty-acyl-CoA synthase/long-chain acyl-CoA synthetase n=1 Tax=Acinetobacter calcoaceticus TaxID=471 RepID=A0A4R1Y8J4_ACICA|nr:fatty-acyl-CoA synthase/long-chain acyl-CoA synthetase [Acinetobacter calcoaceticus]
MLKEPNRNLVKSYWEADQSIPLNHMTVGDALRNAAALAPEREALIEKIPQGWPSLTGAAQVDRRWTYAQLLADSLKCADWLLQRFGVGERICVWAPNVPEWIILQYGAAFAGLVLVTANPALRQQELEYVLSNSRASALFHTDSFRGSDMAAIANQVLSEQQQAISFTGWLDQVRQCQAEAALPQVQPTDAVQIQYTSGTTGHPKGVLLHHMGMVNNTQFMAARVQLQQEVFITPMPLFHTSGSVMCVLGCVNTLSTLVLMVVFEPKMVLETIKSEGGTILGAVPTMLLALLEQLKQQSYEISSLKLVISGGSPVPVALTARLRQELGCNIATVYGQTELSPMVCFTSVSDADEDKANTVGQPLWHAEVRIVDPAHEEVVDIGVEGEIQVRGYQTMLGYFDKAQATKDTLLSDGWLRTGDLGSMDARGYCKVTGRLKDMIIRGGENIYPAEIEGIIMKHAAVADVAVFGLPDEQWGEVVAVALRLHAGSDVPSAQSLKAHCRESIAAHKSPQAWYVCESFPLTGSGKVQKFRLKELALEGGLKAL